LQNNLKTKTKLEEASVGVHAYLLANFLCLLFAYGGTLSQEWQEAKFLAICRLLMIELGTSCECNSYELFW